MLESPSPFSWIGFPVGLVSFFFENCLITCLRDVYENSKCAGERKKKKLVSNWSSELTLHHSACTPLIKANHRAKPESNRKNYISFGIPTLCILMTTSVTDYFSKRFQFSSVQLLSHVRLFVTPWIAARQAPLSITNSQSLLKFMPIQLVMPSSHLILCRPLLLLPLIPPSIRVFSNESTLRIRWPMYWSFNFSISPSNEHPGLISFRMDGLDLLAVQGTLKSLLQYHNSKASIF